MSDRLVICSVPADDDYIGNHYNADYANIAEYSWDILKLKILEYNEVLLVHNGDNNNDFFKLITFGNIYGIDTNNILGADGPLDDNIEYSFHVNSKSKKQIQKNQVLFIGCSHTYGIGHSKSDTVYTHILSKMLGKQPLVDAHPAKGNWLTEEKIQTYNLKNSTIVIQFTDIFRIMLDGEHHRGHLFNRAQSEVFSDVVLASIFIEQVKRIVNLLRANNVRFVFFHLSHFYPLVEEIDSILSSYKEFVFLKDWGIDTGDLGNHSGVLSHTLWAENLFERLTNLYTLS